MERDEILFIKASQISLFRYSLRRQLANHSLCSKSEANEKIIENFLLAVEVQQTQKYETQNQNQEKQDNAKLIITLVHLQIWGQYCHFNLFTSKKILKEI